MYTANPEIDAVRHIDEQERISSAQEFVEGRIRQALMQDVMHTDDLHSAAIPYRDWLDGLQTMTLADAVGESLGEDKVMAKVLAVLQKSACPLVAELREAIAQDYIDSHAVKLEPGDFA